MLSYTDEDRGDTLYSDQPLVAVVIPAFNASTYIERTLRSAMRQTYAALEIIVVNDGSTGDTVKLVEQIAVSDSPDRLLSTPNRGVAAARNTGIEASSGQFVHSLMRQCRRHQVWIIPSAARPAAPAPSCGWSPRSPDYCSTTSGNPRRRATAAIPRLLR